MANALGLHLAAIATLLPAAVLPLWRTLRPSWQAGATVLAAMGPTTWVTYQLTEGWHTGFSATLWVAIATSALVFFVVTMVNRHAWRLATLLMPYLAILGLLAAVTAEDPGPVLAMRGQAPPAWLVFHIVVSVVTYALLTVSGVSALAAFLQERALKRKRPNRLTRLLPSVTESERLSVGLLSMGEAVLGLGLLSGMAVSYFTAGTLLVLDHKTLLSVLAFLVIGGLLAAHAWAGVRGRAAARYLLLGYLLLTLAFPGVKFVSTILA
ncbi:cytochrome C assembly family protein [Roseospira navarrensis]|uniref:Cytochrome c assembly protein domain-containing protein n=1 Tax=Roseospira navarrensis TaxID=140058 RepID=A0A7X2D5U3_9PROT|nr:cytochrome c biogenesis protein CcsA [Roseospira navarrensis]MQX37600.1 hypothetical protein [Roseospira navarrensis]